MDCVKRIICIIAALAVICTALTGCGSPAADDAGIDIYALADEMSAAAKLPDMLSIRSGDDRAEKGFAAISDLGYGKVEAFSLQYAADGSAYELAVIELKDPSDMAALEKSLRTHIENRIQQFRYYDPDEAPRAEGAIAAVSGRYAALIMCDDNSSVKAVFDRITG